MWEWIGFFTDMIGGLFALLFEMKILDVSVAWIIMASFVMYLLVRTLLFKP